MRTSDWQDYELVDTSSGERLERWGNVVLIRPDPTILWETPKKNPLWKNADARYERSSKGGGHWESRKTLPPVWAIGRGGLTFRLKTMGFKAMESSQWLTLAFAGGAFFEIETYSAKARETWCRCQFEIKS